MEADVSRPLARTGRAAAVQSIRRQQHGRALDECLDAATELAPALARRVLARAGLALLQDAARAREPERLKRLLDIQRLLHRQQHELAAAAGATLAHLVACHTAASATGPGFDSLWLLPGEQAEETGAVERVAASLEDAVADRRQAWRQALQGRRAKLPAGADPLGPTTWLRALRGAMARCGMEVQTRTLLLDYCGQQLGPELAALYTQLCVLLRARGATPPLPQPDPVPARGSASGLARLRRLEGAFPGDGAAPAAQAAAFGSAADRLALRERITNLLVSALAADERLAPAAGRLLRDLRPHLLEAARRDQGFLADGAHPWRQVLAALTQRAMLWPAARRRGVDRFLRPLAACVHEAGGQAPGSEAAAAHVLAALQRQRGRWHDEVRCGRAAAALRKAEYRNVVARGVAADLGLRPDFAGAPAVLKHFLVGPWSQAMAAAALLDIGEDDPGNHGRTAGDLLWSVGPGAAAREPARLARILPRLIANLRRGLRSIEHPEGETAAFLRWLGAFYRQALPPGAGDASLDALGSALEAAGPQPASAVPGPLGASQPWLTPAEAAEGHLLDAAQLHEQFPRVAIEGLDLPAAALRAPGGLACGAILEVRRGRGWERWAVEWASRHGVLFLFANAAGRLRSLTAPALASLMRAGVARIVCPQPLADATLDSLAQLALRTTLPGPGKNAGGTAPAARRPAAGAAPTRASEDQ